MTLISGGNAERRTLKDTQWWAALIYGDSCCLATRSGSRVGARRE
jgi:hypothetical protein